MNVSTAVRLKNDHLSSIPYGSGQQCALRSLQCVHLRRRPMRLHIQMMQMGKFTRFWRDVVSARIAAQPEAIA